MKKIILITFVFFYGILSIAQTATQKELENKYWNYRDRYKKIFCQLGTKQGQSLVATSLGFSGCGSDYKKFINGTEQSVLENNSYHNLVGFGDATIDQGFYMMVLASEYWILKNKNQLNTDAGKSLKNELYFAINTVERLDKRAEKYYDPALLDSLNGFFLRGDADNDYLKYFNETLNKEDANAIQQIGSIAGANQKGPQVGFTDTVNGFVRYYDVDSFRIKEGGLDCEFKTPLGFGHLNSQGGFDVEMSQDQVYGLMLGFVSIMKWVDTDLTVDPDGVAPLPSKNIHQWVKDITHRIMTHCSKTRSTSFPVFDADDFTKIAIQACQDIFERPWHRVDTAFHNPPQIRLEPIFSVSGSFIGFDTILVPFTLEDRDSAQQFSGATFRTCDINKAADLVALVNIRKIASSTVFKEANYIITNPANNNDLVHRGAIATPMAYPFKLTGEWITGYTYPEPKAKFTNTVQAVRWGANVLYLGAAATAAVHVTVAGSTVAVPAALAGSAKVTALLQFLAAVAPEILVRMSLVEDPEKVQEMINAFPQSCVLTVPSPDALSLCIMGKPLMVQHKDFWRDLWNEYGNDHFIKTAMKETLPLNLVQNLAIASGTWDQATFNSWASFHGYPFADILYASVNNLNPAKPKAFYENTLAKAQCEGVWHAGFLSNFNITEKEYDYCKPFGHDFLFSIRNPSGDSVQFARQKPGLDYMLMYNLYRMNEIKWWGANDGNTYAKTNCPCTTYPMIENTNHIRSILEKTETTNFQIDGRTYSNRKCIQPLTTLFSETVEVKPIYDYYADFNTRIPNYLLHDANLSGQTGFVIVPPITVIDTIFGHIKVEQDLTICNSTLKLFSMGKLSIDESNTPEFPSKIIVSAGSVLELHHESLLEINNNTQVIIEKGAILRLFPGHRIILNGPDAILHINGRLELEPNANFQPLAGPNGYGKIIIENNWGEQFVEAKGNNKYIIDAGRMDSRGNGYLHSANIKALGNYHLIAKGPTGMKTGWSNVDSFIIRNSIVLIDDGSKITSDAKNARIDNSFIGGERLKRSRGIYLHQSNGYVTNTTIRYVENGINYKPLNGKKPLKLDDVKIQDCNIGINSQGGLVDVKNSHISFGAYSGEMGADILGAAGSSFITKSDIFAPVYTNVNYPRWDTTNTIEEKGIRYLGSTFLKLKETSVNDGIYGIESNDGNLNLECSRVQSPNTGSLAKYGIVKNGGALQMRYGYNLLESHYLKILSNDALLSIDKGKNVINRSNNTFLVATLHPNQTLGSSALYTSGSFTNPLSILATENHWQSNNSSGTPPTGFIPHPAGNSNINIISWSPSLTPTWYDLGYNPQMNMGSQLYNAYYAANCPKTTSGVNVHNPIDILPGELIQVFSSNGTFGGINAISMPVNPPNTINPNHNFGTALESTIVKYNDSLVDFDVVLPELKYLSKAALLDTLFELSLFTYSATQQAYYHSLYDPSLTDSLLELRNNSFGNDMLTYQNDLITKHDGNEVFWRDMSYELHRDKALILRSLDRRPEALAVLNYYLTIADDTLHVKQASVWSCFIEQEQMVLDNVIPIDSMNFYACMDSYNFLPDTATENSSSAMMITSNNTLVQENMVLYPNPSNQGFYLKAEYELEKNSIIIFDALGRKVEAPVSMLTKNKLFINSSNLIAGIYTISYSSKEEEKVQFKVTVLR